LGIGHIEESDNHERRRLRSVENTSRRMKSWARSLYRRDTIKDDAVAGVVLGVESVPDGLASGLLAGVNPIFGSTPS
jgi:MFS superfamily sulfate permease-like transporter